MKNEELNIAIVDIQRRFFPRYQRRALSFLSKNQKLTGTKLHIKL